MHCVRAHEQKQGYEMPSREVIWDQIQLAQASMFLYAALPVLSEWFVENKLTLCYYYLDEVGGWPYYLLWTVLYLALVEVGVSRLAQRHCVTLGALLIAGRSSVLWDGMRWYVDSAGR
jgi:hypothetical protein